MRSVSTHPGQVTDAVLPDVVLPEHLAPAAVVDSDSAEVRAFAERAAAGATEPTEVAIRTCTSAEAG